MAGRYLGYYGAIEQTAKSARGILSGNVKHIFGNATFYRHGGTEEPVGNDLGKYFRIGACRR